MPSEPRPLAATEVPADDQLLAFADSIVAQSAPEKVAPECESRAHLGFVLGESRFAIPIACCREIVRVGELTRIPEAPSQVRGVFNLRGRVVPVIDLRLRVGLPPATVTSNSRLVMVEAKGRLFGLLVDRVLGISKIALADISPDAGSASGVLAGKARAGDQIVMLLDQDQILLPPGGEKP